jgi:hypothetical protein
LSTFTEYRVVLIDKDGEYDSDMFTSESLAEIRTHKQKILKEVREAGLDVKVQIEKQTGVYDEDNQPTDHSGWESLYPVWNLERER